MIATQQVLGPREVLQQMTALHDRLHDPDQATRNHLKDLIEQAAQDGEASSRFFPFHLLPPGAAAPLFAGAAARDLYGARAYQVTAQYTDLALVLAADFGGFDEYEMPAPYGFAWLDKPYPLPSSEVPARVLTWGLQPTGGSVPDDGGPAGGVRLAVWGGESLDLIATATLVTGQPGLSPVADLARRVWALMDMEMTSAEPSGETHASPDAYTARPLSEDGVVRVVQLRHGHSDGSGPGGQGIATGAHHVDWSHCWLVKGHRRKAPHGGTFKNGQAVTWVHAYLKGNTDKPFKLPDVLYRLGQ